MVKMFCSILVLLAVNVVGYNIPYLNKPPTIDGKVSESEWKGALKFVKKPVEYEYVIRLGWCGDCIYISANCKDKNPDKIKADVKQRDGSGIWTDDCIEIFIDTNRDLATYYHFIINAGGALYDEYVRDVSWDVKSIKYAARKTQRGWSCEVMVPVGSFNKGEVYSRWGINVMRHFQGGWQVLTGRAHKPNSWAEFTIPDKVAEKILKPILKKKFRTIKTRLTTITKRAKQSKLYADIYPVLESSRVKLTKIASSIGSAKSQSLIDRLDKLSKDINRLERITNRAMSFERISKKLNQKTPPKIIAFTLSPMVKVRKDFLLPSELGDRIRISSAKGESESYQIVLATWNRPIRTVRFKVTDLVNQKDTNVKITRNNIHIYKECYVYAYQTCLPAFPRGWYPDPLVKTEVFDIPSFDYQPVWITIDVPRSVRAGIYKGRVTIVAPRIKPITIPIELKVRNFTLPIRPALKTSFSVWGKTIAYQLGIDRKKPENAKHIEKLIYQYYWPMALKYRITLRNIPIYGPRFNRFVKDILEKGATTIRLPLWQTLNASVDAKKNIQDMLIKNGWINLAYLYIWDEPGRNLYPKVIERAKKIKPYAPKIKVLCTVSYDKTLDPYIDIWVPRFSWFDSNPQAYYDAIKRGDEVWLYTCVYPQRPYPNLFLELPGIEPRICIWLCWRYQVSGFLYYSTNYWKSKDIWLDVRGYPAANLDGVLFFPTRDGKPIPTIRLEILRDGIEDYDYFAILQKLTDKLKTLPSTSESNRLLSQANKLLNVTDVVKSFTVWTKDPAKLQSHRDAVGELIEKIKRYLQTHNASKSE